MNQSQLLVGMADIQVTKGPAFYSCLGLGSCISLVMMDVARDVSGMAHIVLPKSLRGRPNEKPGKFADTGVEALVVKLEELGAERGDLQIAFVGGAQVFKFTGEHADEKLEIGRRNAEAVEAALGMLGLHVVAKDMGGSVGRSVTFCTVSGEIRVRTIHMGEQLLCSLR